MQSPVFGSHCAGSQRRPVRNPSLQEFATSATSFPAQLDVHPEVVGDPSLQLGQPPVVPPGAASELEGAPPDDVVVGAGRGGPPSDDRRASKGWNPRIA